MRCCPRGIELHNIYVPAGGDIPDPEVNDKFAHKLRFLDEQAAYFAARAAAGKQMIVVGDLNVAPLEQDVWSHKQLLGIVSHTPIEVEKLTAWQQAGGFVDTMRQFVPASEKLYTWWSYRNQDWNSPTGAAASTTSGRRPKWRQRRRACWCCAKLATGIAPAITCRCCSISTLEIAAAAVHFPVSVAGRLRSLRAADFLFRQRRRLGRLLLDVVGQCLGHTL